MKTKILSLLFIIALSFSATSCLDDDYLFDFDNMKPVIEIPGLDQNTNLSYKAGSESVSVKLYVNYSIADWRDIKEDIPVVVDIDTSYLEDDEELLPASSYSPTFPLTMTIKKASDVVPDRDKLNNQSAEETITVNLNDANLVSGKTYVLPVKIKEVPSQYTISGNFGYKRYILVVK